MSVFDLFGGTNINNELAAMRQVKGAVLLDVRDRDEFARGHIPGAVNVPVDDIESIAKVTEDKETPIFAYCLSGSRSSKAVSALKAMGYTKVTNIGGINRYKGEKESAGAAW